MTVVIENGSIKRKAEALEPVVFDKRLQMKRKLRDLDRLKD